MNECSVVLDAAQEIDYERDFFLWVTRQIQLLCSEQLKTLDVVNLVDEVESMGLNQRHAVKSIMIIIMLHLLKYQFQPERRSNSWRSTLLVHRRKIRDLFTDSPSLRPYALMVFEKNYQDARKQASVETGLPMTRFPKDCPFEFTQILDENFYGTLSECTE